MNVHISDKVILTVFVVIKLNASDNCPRTHIIIYPILVWETIQPKLHVVYHHNNEVIQVLLERQFIGDCPYPFFYSSDVSSYGWDVFIPSSDIDVYC